MNYNVWLNSTAFVSHPSTIPTYTTMLYNLLKTEILHLWHRICQKWYIETGRS